MESAAESPSRVGWVGVEQNKIALVSYSKEEAEAWSKEGETQRIECRGRIIMPGLINTHSHISMTLLRNYADEAELMEWLTNYIWPFEARLTAEDITSGARLGVAEMLLGGTTTFVDMYWQESAVAQAVEQMGIRALLTECVLDGREESFLEGMQRLEEAASRCSRVTAGVGPHAPYTCSEQTLRLAAEYAEKRNMPLTIHLSETAFERDMMSAKGALSPLDYLCKAGVVTPRTLLAHSVYLTEEEIARVAELGASVAHNAQSNMKLASGIAPISDMLRAGVNCTIATDGASSNNDLDMWEEMRTTLLLQRVSKLSAKALTPYEVLYMATHAGAKAIGMSETLGSIEVGKIADIAVIDGRKPHMRPRDNSYSALVYCGKASDVEHLFVDGVQRVCGGEIVGADIEAIISDVEERRERLSRAE